MAARSVLNGRYAEASVGGVLIALLFEWSVDVETTTVDLTAHGDTWKYIIPIVAGWTFKAKGYVVPASTGHQINALWSSGGPTANVTVAGFSGSVATGTKIFEGTGVPTKGSLSAPMELATQEFEITGFGAPSVGV
jgi:hypothetical protein